MDKMFENKKGFSLMELLIAMAIVSIIASATMVSMSSQKRNTEVETAAREVAAAIRQAQNNSLTGKGASSSCSQYNFSYTKSTPNSPNYSIDCSGSDYTNYALKNGVTFANAGPGTFSFSIPFGNLNPASDATIQVVKGSSSYYVCLDKGGDVSEVKNLPCP
jgi:prepilin-type N-terminal cleavage/methylation domain-containing protein